MPPDIGTLFDQHYDELYRYAYRHLRHQIAAQDVVAQAFERLLVARVGSLQNVRAWLYRTTHNLIIDDSRQQKHRQHTPLDETHTASTPHPEEVVTTNLTFDQAMEALEMLTEDQKAVVTLKHLHGFSNNEIANILDKSVGAVKALDVRGLTTLRAQLKLEEVRHA